MQNPAPHAGEQWQELHPGAEQLAKGKWSIPDEEPKWFAGFRRYGATKLCEVMHAYVSKRIYTQLTELMHSLYLDSSWVTV